MPSRDPRLVGREAELSRLITAFERAASGQGGVVLVEGDAGIGKTRLVAELAAEARGAGAVVAWGRGAGDAGAPPYWPWRQVARAAGVPPWPEAAVDRFAVAETMAGALARAAEAAPLVVALDDLHDADVASVTLAALVAPDLQRSHVLIVGTARPLTGRAEEAPLAAALRRLRRAASVVSLAPLRQADVEAMIADLAGRTLPARAVDAVAEMAGGNPLYVRELVGVMATQPALPGPGRVVLPPTLQAAIRERLAPALHQASEVVAAAAVLGQEFDVGTVAAVVGSDIETVLAALEDAARAGVVDPTTAGTGRRRFSHPLVREVLYDDLPIARKIQLHAAAAAVLEGRSEELASRARHLLASVPLTPPVAAAAAARTAAEAAAAAHGDDEAADLLAAAHDVLEAGGAPARERADMLLCLGDACLRCGRVARAHGAFRQAADLARRLGAPALLARAALGTASRVAFQREPGDVPELLREALAAVGTDEHQYRVTLLAALARTWGSVGELDRAWPFARAAEHEARALGAPALLADALSARHLLVWNPDSVDERLRLAGEVLQLAEATGDRRLSFEATAWRLTAELEACDVVAVDVDLKALSALSVELREPRFKFYALARRAMRAYMSGSDHDGDRLLEQVRSLGHRIEEPDTDAVCLAVGAVGTLMRNDAAELDAAATEWEELASSSTSVVDLAVAALFRGRQGALDQAERHLALLAGDPATMRPDLDWLPVVALRAEVASRVRDADQCWMLYERLLPYAGQGVVGGGALAFVGVVDHYLGVLAASLGLHDDARRHLLQAVAEHRRLGAPWWEAESAGALAALDIRLGTVGGSADTRALLLRREGDRWLVGDEAHPVTMGDRKGLHYLATLLARPGVERHVLDLVVPGGTHPSDAGIVIDGRARAAYKTRLVDLRAELDEAELDGNMERASRAGAEIDALTEQLAAAFGLGGRSRRAGSHAERARVSVRKAIAATITSIGREDAALGRLLRTTIRTGTWCCYEPDPRFPVEWKL